MKLKRFDNILTIQDASGEVTGFHAQNLQVAHLDVQILDVVAQLNADALARSLPLSHASSGNLDVETELRAWNDERSDLVKDQHLAQAVRSFTINIAQICNLKCTYCAAGGDGTYGSDVKEIDLDQTYAQLQMLLHGVPNGGSFVITFLGGEPLIYPEAIRKIARYARLQVAGRDIDLRFDIVTNGTLITPLIAELLASIEAHVTVSLDGPAEINDRQRPTASGRGSTERTLKGLQNLLRMHDQLGSISVGSVFGPHFTDVEATYEFLKPFRLDAIKFDFAASANDEEASLAYTESLLRVADRAFREGGETELRRIGLFDRTFRTLDSQERVQNHCGAGKSLLQTDTSGKLYVCQWFVNDPDEVVGEGTTIDREKLQAYADPIRELNGCNGCWARFVCGGGCMFVNKTKTGSKHQRDNVFCQRTRSVIAKGIQLYAKAREQHET